MLGLLETKISGEVATKCCKSLGFDKWMRIESVGFSGIIWLLWKSNWDIEVLSTHPQFAHVRVKQGNVRPWVMTVVYASPNQTLRNLLWRDLSVNELRINDPWMVVGDFNSVSSPEEVLNDTSYSMRRSSKFMWILGTLGANLHGVGDAVRR